MNGPEAEQSGSGAKLLWEMIVRVGHEGGDTSHHYSTWQLCAVLCSIRVFGATRGVQSKQSSFSDRHAALRQQLQVHEH
jgi:hypothetical protein